MRLRNLLFAVIIILPPSVQAGFRISAGLGLGSTGTSNEVSKSEGPLVESFSVEFLQHSRLYLGVEHIRSLNMSPLSTSISFTGMFMRYYMNAVPVAYATSENILPNEIIIRDVSLFVGVGAGFGQSSLPVDINNLSPNAAGIYISPRTGAEMNLTRRLGVRGELMLVNSIIGKGTLSSMSLLGSIYYSF